MELSVTKNEDGGGVVVLLDDDMRIVKPVQETVVYSFELKE